MSARVLQMVDRLFEAGLVSQAKRRRVQIHASYWILRDRGVPEMDAKNAVADAYRVEIRTVSEYVYPRDQYESILGGLPAA